MVNATNGIIQSEKLTKLGVIHGISTKEHGNMSFDRDAIGQAPTNMQIMMQDLGIDPKNSVILIPRIKHTANIALVSPKFRKGRAIFDKTSPEIVELAQFPGSDQAADFIDEYDQGVDGCISQKQNLYIATLQADCAPVMFFDPVTKTFGLVHAGVLGALSGIVKNALKQMQAWCKAEAKNIFCYVGPCITGQQYQIKNSSMWPVFKQFLSEDEATNFDLKAFITKQMLATGVAESNIEIAPQCTSDDQFFSNFQAKTPQQKLREGRNIAIIGFK